jgi:hypothetical protein
MIYSAQKLNKFLQNTLSGYYNLNWIESGQENIDKVLQNPEKYYLGHISGDLDAWARKDKVIFSFNNGCHFVFSPINVNVKNGLKYKNKQWQ